MSGAAIEPTARRCSSCGAVLAADQRYCLNCGDRQGDPRIDFRQYGNGKPLPTEEASAPVSPPDEPHRPHRDFAPLAAVGGIAVLGLMLLVGVLIGRGSGEDVAPPPPQIVRVGGGEETTASDEPTGGSDEVGGKTSAAKAGAKAGGAEGGATKPPPPEITASDAELEALEGQSPQDYSEASAKLPDEIATPGKAPPKDSKTPGGGSTGTTIE